MKAGRELDAKVAETLGWSERIGGWIKFTEDGPRFIDEKHFRPSTTWNGMGVLVEEARKQEIYLEFINYNEGYRAEARRKSGDKQTLIASIDEYHESVPLAVSLVFLKASGVAI